MNPWRVLAGRSRTAAVVAENDVLLGDHSWRLSHHFGNGLNWRDGVLRLVACRKRRHHWCPLHLWVALWVAPPIRRRGCCFRDHSCDHRRRYGRLDTVYRLCAQLT